MISHAVVGIIPARLGSERFPGKVLHTFRGKTLLQHTYDRARRIRSLSGVYIATDSEKIADAGRGFGAEILMTSPFCRSGSDRVAEAARKLNAGIVVNIQADEPFLPSEAVERPLDLMRRDRSILVGTAAARIRKKEELYDPNVVKVVLDARGDALYFSRSLIPFPRTYFSHDSLAQSRKVIFYKHIGVYLFRARFLARFARMKSSVLERTEKLEQLRILEAGYRIRTVIIRRDSPCVDTIEDLKRLG